MSRLEEQDPKLAGNRLREHNREGSVEHQGNKVLQTKLAHPAKLERRCGSAAYSWCAMQPYSWLVAPRTNPMIAFASPRTLHRLQHRNLGATAK